MKTILSAILSVDRSFLVVVVYVFGRADVLMTVGVRLAEGCVILLHVSNFATLPHQFVLQVVPVHSYALFPGLVELVHEVAVADTGDTVRQLVTLLLEAGHGHALLPQDLGVNLIIRVLLLNL